MRVCYAYVHGNKWVYLLMYMQAEARAGHWMLPTAFYLLALRRGLSLNWKFTVLSTLAVQGDLRLYCLHP